MLAILLLMLAACQSDPPKVAYDDLPEGNAASGAMTFREEHNDAPACSSCHEINGSDSTAPDLSGFGERAGTRVDNQSAGEYAYWSIIRPTKHIVTPYSNTMYSEYEDKLTPQQIADLIAYVLGL